VAKSEAGTTLTQNDVTALLKSAARDELLRYQARFDSTGEDELNSFVTKGVTKLFENNTSPSADQLRGADRKLRFVVRELCAGANLTGPIAITKTIWDEVKKYLCPLPPFC
jgi:hypothetical protein